MQTQTKDLEMKRQMVSTTVKDKLKTKDRQFLIFMANLLDKHIDYSKTKTVDLLDNFINFEEAHCGEELTQQKLDYLMQEYVPAFQVFGPLK